MLLPGSCRECAAVLIEGKGWVLAMLARKSGLCVAPVPAKRPPLPSIPLVSDAEGMGRAEERAVSKPTKERAKAGRGQRHGLCRLTRHRAGGQVRKGAWRGRKGHWRRDVVANAPNLPVEGLLVRLW